jgi:dTDP-D-glucose 4,6-dehydratase
MFSLYWKNYGVPTVFLRYFTVYGPRQRQDMRIHKFVKTISNNEEIIVYGDGSQTRDALAYLDTYTWCRPFDDQMQARIKEETSAFYEIMLHVDRKDIKIVGSDTLLAEIEDISDEAKYSITTLTPHIPHILI